MRKSLRGLRQARAGGNPVFVGAFHNQRTGKAHFLMQKPDGIVCAVIGTQRIGTDQFGKTSALCAGERFSGFISYSRTATPRIASCHAASAPARPAPITFALNDIFSLEF